MFTLLVESLTDQEALDLAQFFERCSFSEFMECAIDEAEAYRMRDAAAKVRRALVENGYNPR